MTKDSNSPASARAERTVDVLIFCALFFGAAAFDHPVDYDATASRFLQLSAIVDRGTLNLDATHQRTVDKALYGGHYYSNKPPGAALLGLPLYWTLRHLPVLRDSPPLMPFARYAVRLLTTTLPFALLGVVLFRSARRMGAAPWRAFLMVMAYAFGTIAFIHSTLFSGHQITAALAFFSFALVLRVPGRAEDPPRPGRPGRFLLAGLLAGFATLTDYHAVIAAFFLSIYVLRRREPPLNFLLFVLGGLLSAYNVRCFENPITLSYFHLAIPRYRDEARVTWPSLKLLGILLFSPARGLFVIMPVLLLSLAGLGAWFARRQHTREALLVIAIGAGFLLFNAGFGGWHSGWTFGPRYLVPLLPFLAFAMAFGRWSLFSFVLLFIPSCFQVLAAVAGMPHTPQEFWNPLVEVILPCMGYGYFARNAGMFLRLPGILSVLPIAAVVAGLAVAAFRIVCRWPAAEPDDERDHPPLLRAVAGVWLLADIALLAFVRTPSPKLVHSYRSRLLQHAAVTTRSADLARAAVHEAALAEEQ